MKELEQELEKGNGKDKQLKLLIEHVKNLRKENAELKQKVDAIYKAVDEGAITSEEKEELKLKTDAGTVANPEVAKVLKRAKSGNGVAVGEVESILDCSRRHALKMMRKIAKEFDKARFKRGSGNKPSMLKKSADLEI